MSNKTAGFGWKVNCVECCDTIASALILVRGGHHRSTVEVGRVRPNFRGRVGRQYLSSGVMDPLQREIGPVKRGRRVSKD